MTRRGIGDVWTWKVSSIICRVEKIIKNVLKLVGGLVDVLKHSRTSYLKFTYCRGYRSIAKLVKFIIDCKIGFAFHFRQKKPSTKTIKSWRRMFLLKFIVAVLILHAVRDSHIFHRNQ